MKRFLAIAVIWLGCTVAWMILGSTLHLRTDSLSGSLIEEVYALWGPPGRQAPPHATYQKRELTEETVIEQIATGSIKKTVQHETKVDVPVALDASDVHAQIALEQKRKGLMWFPTYSVDFRASYDLPQLLNPGPLATKVTLFAPVSLLFFFFVVAVLSQVRGHQLHPMHYFLLSCAFFAFHLLFAYLVDHWAILPSFAGAAAVSVFLVVSYARLFVGWKFALREMGLAQLLYLVLFSYTFFWEGFTGLAIAIGATATLFFVMQITGRSTWRDDPSRGSPGPAAARHA